MSERIAIEISDSYRLIIGAYNWTLQGKKLNKEGELEWSPTTNCYYPDAEWFAQGLLRHSISDEVVAGGDILEAIDRAREKVLAAVKTIEEGIINAS